MKSILIIDDEAHILQLYKEVFRREGCQVSIAPDIESALAQLEKEPCDLVILDIELDEDNGLNFLKYLKSARPNMPVILNSAYSIYKSDFHSWAADAYIVKTSDLEPLKSKVKELLDVDSKYPQKPAAK